MKRPVITVIGLCGESVFMEVDHFHEEGETVHAKSVHTEPGGKGYNQAVACARLGAEVNFIGCCGNDRYGEICEEFLEREGINSVMMKTGEAGTALATILTDVRGQNRVTVYRGAAELLSSEFIEKNRKTIENSDYLLLNFECPKEVNEAAQRIASDKNVKIVLNPAPPADYGEDFISRCFAVVPNEFERQFLPERLERAVVTLGSEGAEITENGTVKRIPAVKCEAVDTTGAGDTFCAALTIGLSEGKTLEESAVFATRCAAYSVTKKYVMPSLPTRADIGG